MAHKIAIIGPESSGKSVLAQQLAVHFNEPLVKEYAREHLEKNGTFYEKVDLDFFAKKQRLQAEFDNYRKQIEKENAALNNANQFLFCDTNTLSIKVWSLYKYGTCSHYLQTQTENSIYDKSLLLYPDLPYQDDPLREDQPLKNRLELFDLFEQELKKANATYSIIKGLEKDRLDNAIKSLQSLFSF